MSTDIVISVFHWVATSPLLWVNDLANKFNKIAFNIENPIYMNIDIIPPLARMLEYTSTITIRVK